MINFEFHGISLGRSIYLLSSIVAMIFLSLMVRSYSTMRIAGSDKTDFDKHYSRAMREWASLARGRRAESVSQWQSEILRNNDFARKSLIVARGNISQLEDLLKSIENGRFCKLREYNYSFSDSSRLKSIEASKSLESLGKGKGRTISLLSTPVKLIFVTRDLECAAMIEKLVSQYAPGIPILEEVTVQDIIKDGKRIASSVSLTWRWLSWSYELGVA